MSPKNKRRFTRKKYNRGKKNIDNIENSENKQDATDLQPSNIKCRSVCPKMRILDIIAKITTQLKSDLHNRMLTLLETILSIADCRSEKENMLFQLVNMLFTHLLDCDDDEISTLITNMSSTFLPNALKKLLVDDDALTVKPLLFGAMDMGHFGVLIEGTLKKPDGSRVQVVVKESVNSVYDQHILSQAKVMAQFDHDNVIKILAFHKILPRFAVEFMDLGDLEEALQTYDFSDQKLVLILKDVAAGMEYIAEKKYVHRNLMCNNVLLNSQGKCKISGFSYCRYVGDTAGVCEDKDMDFDAFYFAPEIHKTNKFTTKTDMWAMGLLVWETLYTACDSLRRGQLLSRQYMKYLWLHRFPHRGDLPNPGRCSPLLWYYVKSTVLNKDPQVRPTFTKLRKQLDEYDPR